jgi:hypothetical protein
MILIIPRVEKININLSYEAILFTIPNPFSSVTHSGRRRHGDIKLYSNFNPQ